MTEKPFVYGMSVEGPNFTDREKETQRLKKDFENGINVCLISPRRMGKTSLVKRVIELTKSSSLAVVYMDIYDCRDEYDFYNRFAYTILKETSGKMEKMMDSIKEFLVRLTPKVSFGSGTEDFSVSLGITPQNYSPEEILDLPEKIAAKKGIRIVVCIDEFQQIGEFRDSLQFQKLLRGIWQHQKNVSFCLFGSKRHLMENIFQSRKMPFYMFGEMMSLDFISSEFWVDYIVSRFSRFGKRIDARQALEICGYVGNYSSYVQQLAWNVLAETEDEVDAATLERGKAALMQQCDSLFIQQTQNLTSYQLNFLRLVALGYQRNLLSAAEETGFRIGSASNVNRLTEALVEKELIETHGGIHMLDPVFGRWFRENMI